MLRLMWDFYPSVVFSLVMRVIIIGGLAYGMFLFVRRKHKAPEVCPGEAATGDKGGTRQNSRFCRATTSSNNDWQEPAYASATCVYIYHNDIFGTPARRRLGPKSSFTLREGGHILGQKLLRREASDTLRKSANPPKHLLRGFLSFPSGIWQPARDYHYGTPILS